MSKFIKIFCTATLFAVVFLFASQAHAQVPAKTFGISAGFDSEWDQAGVLYTISNSLEVGVGLSFRSVSFTVDQGTAAESQTSIGVNPYIAYYLSSGDINPYLQLSINYMGYPEDKQGSQTITSNDLGIEFAFGAQAFVVKGLGIWANIGINYNMNSVTTKVGSAENKVGTNTMKLFTSAVGASFYF